MENATRFQLYRFLIEEVREARRARRELSNAFLTLNLAGVGALGFLIKDGETAKLPAALLIWCVVALIFTCLIWRTSNKYYTHMLKSKYEIINDLENALATDLGGKPIQEEYAKVGKLKPNKAFFSLEYTMPALFVIGYIVFLIYRLEWASFAAAAEAAWAQLQDLIAR